SCSMKTRATKERALLCSMEMRASEEKAMNPNPSLSRQPLSLQAVLRNPSPCRPCSMEMRATEEKALNSTPSLSMQPFSLQAAVQPLSLQAAVPCSMGSRATEEKKKTRKPSMAHLRNKKTENNEKTEKNERMCNELPHEQKNLQRVPVQGEITLCLRPCVCAEPGT
ncbi:hypothetical protein L9F63_000580, partial [Diploptera punctata]